jgi:hypothetical protein
MRRDGARVRRYGFPIWREFTFPKGLGRRPDSESPDERNRNLLLLVARLRDLSRQRFVEM